MSAPAAASKLKPLTSHQLQFVEHYCAHWNGTRAAEEASYSPKSARQQASNLLADERIQATVARRMALYSMSAAKAQAKLAEWGRGTVAHFLKANEDGAIVINLAHADAHQHLHLVKQVKQKRRVITTELDLHDAKDAVHKTLLLSKQAPQKVDHTTLGKKLPAPQSNIFVPDNGR